ncbi:MAG: AAA family ATPase [Nanoarchaeota archaeon]|nr:AAA family ATPase [Nanoarchaeota archaeon]MBU1321490.1 AAA family ATPase [Nanoarchaeota archaeon]MBU1597374.1 AAA family ATPase [Nanoarchaeota archaeon]MBU2441213.1 AAA family ATPase [Nanoarchaeota archaeon]
MTSKNEQFKTNLMETEFNDILGQNRVKQQVKSALLMDRHIILVGQPGIGKTTLAKNVTKLMPDKTVADCGYNCTTDNPACPKCLEKKEKKEKIQTKILKGNELFVRIQGSPDLTAEDLIGDIDPIKAMKFGPLSLEAFTPGKIFKANNGILFFDEINRCSEKLQNALLQVLEENKITIGSYSFDFDVSFLFIGTMNPDDKSTEPLSDVFLDRFDLIYMEYPETAELEFEIVKKAGKYLIEFPQKLLYHVIEFIRDLRIDNDVEKKPSVRASIGLYERAQSNAKIRGKDKVSVKDVQDVIVSVLSHRISLKPSVKFLKSPEDYIKEEFEKFSNQIGGDG